jgi:hypothetical protein
MTLGNLSLRINLAQHAAGRFPLPAPPHQHRVYTDANAIAGCRTCAAGVA